MDIFNKKTYFYNLPEERIAQTPIEPRDFSRMLVYDRLTEKIIHRHFFDIVDYLNEGDILVVNNTRVLPARLVGKKIPTGANAEVLLLKKKKLDEWEVLLKPARRLKKGTVIEFSSKLTCTVTENYSDGKAVVNFSHQGTFEEALIEVGKMPLPHYIHERLSDGERYQTVYAKTQGSSAAPTAGLHFTEELLEKIRSKGVKIVEVLLHVGLGTFRPVSEDNILNHQMHSEYYEITKESAEEINRAKAEGKRVVAVGTTSIRVLETVAGRNDGKLAESFGETDIFIYPGYKFRIVDSLITNFHLPESTLIMLVSAFCGVEETLNFYRVAVEEKYRFYSFGDACLLL